MKVKTPSILSVILLQFFFVILQIAVSWRVLKPEKTWFRESDLGLRKLSFKVKKLKGRRLQVACFIFLLSLVKY